MKPLIFVIALIALPVATCKSNSDFAGGNASKKEESKKEEEKKKKTDEDQKQNSSEQTKSEPSPSPIRDTAQNPNKETKPAFDTSSLDPNGHNPESDCQICLAKADYLALTLGFRAHMNNSINFGQGPAAAEGFPGSCDIHFVAPDHLHEIYFFCPCNCGWPFNQQP